MTHAMTLDLPEPVYRAIAARAEQSGRTPEALVGEWLGRLARRLFAQAGFVRLLG